jgi:transcriptional regulator with XRE-family HTH domain
MGKLTQVPNRRLRAARRTRGLTQGQLAELANLQVLESTGRVGAMDSTYVSKLETGVHTWPAKAYRRALAAVLGVAGDLELGFYSTRSVDDRFDAEVAAAGGSDEVDRAAFLQAIAGLAAGAVVGGPALEALTRAASPEAPGAVGMTEVEQIRHVSEVFRDWGFQFGGGFGRAAMRGQLLWARSLLDAAATDEARAELHQAVGALANAVAWSSFDAGYHREATMDRRIALSCAEYGRDWRLRANALQDMARQELDQGNADDALSLIELAQVRVDRLTATARAECAATHARVLARLGRTQDTLRAIGTAEEQFAHRDPAEDPPWVGYFDESQLQGHAGRAMLALALREDRVADARDRLRRAVSGFSAEHGRARALTLSDLAILELRVGDPHTGLLHAGQTLAAGMSVQSHRMTTRLRDLDDALATHPGPDARDLRDQIHRMLPT